jgi:hypothetical protein
MLAFILERTILFQNEHRTVPQTSASPIITATPAALWQNP